MEMWGQIVSLVAMVAIILSFQCKSNRNLVLVMGTGALLFALSYFMLGQPSAALYNIITGVLSIACLKESFKNKYIYGIFVALYIGATFITYSDWWSIILLVAQFAGAYSLMFGSGKFIRNMRFFFVSPIWLINNTLICFTLGGTICEIITMTSIIVSFIRYRKTGFEA